MSKEIKFTKDEVKQINDLRLEVSGIFTQLGQISLERSKRLAELQEVETKLSTRHAELVTIEGDLFKVLNEKYGNGNYDPESGVFTPTEQEIEEKETETVK